MEVRMEAIQHPLRHNKRQWDMIFLPTTSIVQQPMNLEAPSIQTL